jgi:hypothetical protein
MLCVVKSALAGSTTPAGMLISAPAGSPGSVMAITEHRRSQLARPSTPMWLPTVGSVIGRTRRPLVSCLAKATVKAAGLQHRHSCSVFHVNKVRELGKGFLCASRFITTSTGVTLLAVMLRGLSTSMQPWTRKS